MFTGTANDFYSSKIGKQEYDVVTCFGLLYHLHSPMHLFEQIINKSKPKTIIIESVHVAVDAALHDEEFNTSGNAFRDKDIITPIPFSFTTSYHTINQVLDSVGYKYVSGLKNYNNIKIDAEYGTSKKDCWLGIYEKS
tara:strand:- start:419 stop:832 length:414 start_codon:yes stop_codon:yes gene_type:complete